MNKKKNRLGEEKLNTCNCLMKIIEYNNTNNIIVEFQDKYKAKVYTNYGNFSKGKVKNPYHPTVCGVGMIGDKYPASKNYKHLKEYIAWKSMIHRCFDKNFKNIRCTYENAICCDEWLLYENFYEWLHSQDNFEKWLNGDRWAIDKDILYKGNEIYSPQTCCLVPNNVNILFVKSDSDKGILPIGVKKNGKGYSSTCSNPFTNKIEYLGTTSTQEQTFQLYKSYKEDIIKRVAREEYLKGNIIESCYNAMMNYEVEITD